MQSAEIERIIQIVTDRVLAQLEVVTQDSILFQDKIEAYPAPYVEKLSADFHFEFGQKQDSDAILLCLSQMTLQQLLAVASLTAIDSETTQVIDFLLKGKPVWVLAAAPQLGPYRKQAKYAVWHELQLALQKVSKFNVHFIKDDVALTQRLKTLPKRSQVMAPAPIKRQFITQLTLQQRWQDKQPLLNEGEVLTDLAAEWARDHRLKV